MGAHLTKQSDQVPRARSLLCNHRPDSSLANPPQTPIPLPEACGVLPSFQWGIHIVLLRLNACALTPLHSNAPETY